MLFEGGGDGRRGDSVCFIDCNIGKILLLGSSA